MTGLERLSKFKHEREINNKKPVENITPPDDSLDTIKTEALARVVNDLAPDFSPDLLNQQQNRELETKVQEATTAVLTENGKFMSRAERQQLIREVMNEIVGLGPIEPLVRDPDVSEIMVNGPNQVYVERKGRIYPTDVRFRDDEHVLHVIEKIISPLGRHIDETSPMVDARLSDGSRVNAIIPPLAIHGPTLTIRKFSVEPYTVEDLISFGTLNSHMALFFKACVEGRLNIIVSGGTGTGKTTTLNVLSSFIPHQERIVTIEDAAELKLQQEHVVSLESRPANIEGKGQVTIRDLVINSLRMRPDRIVVGEARGGEALDMLQAMNTGHDGSLTTVHANSPRDTLSRIETMVLMAGMDLPVRAIREQIASAVNLVVQISRFLDGSRKVTQVTEVVGMESDTITLQDIFVYEQKGFDEQGRVNGRFRPTGIVPKCITSFGAKGINLPLDVFQPRADSVRVVS